MSQGSNEKMAGLYGYTPKPIDLDEGVIIRSLGKGKGQVLMYAGMPGLYLNPKGGLTEDALAVQAGFEVKTDRAEANVQFEIRAAEEAIRARGREVELAIRGEASAEARARMSPAPDKPFPFEEERDELSSEDEDLVTEYNAKGDPKGTEHFHLVHIGAGRWTVHERGASEDLIESTMDRTAALRSMLKLERDTLAVKKLPGLD